MLTESANAVPWQLNKVANLILLHSIELRLMLNSSADLLRKRAVSDRPKKALSLLSLPMALAVASGTAQQAWAGSTPNADSLLPLEEVKTSVHRPNTKLSEAAESINIAFANSQNPEAKSGELDLAGVPILGEMLNENGKFDWGMDIPISFDFGNLIGNPVLIVGTDFPTD